MANIEKRTNSKGEVTYRVKIRLKGYPVQTATFERLTDARNWVQDTESAIRSGRHFTVSESKKRTLAEAIDRYIKDVLPTKPKSIQAQKRQLNVWKRDFGSYFLADVTPALISEYRDKMLNEVTSRKEKRSPATVNRYLAVLSHLFTIAAKEWQWVNTNPISNIRRPSEPKGRIRFLSDAERPKLLAACEKSFQPYLYCIIVLALSTGARKGELMNLTWQNVDFDRGVIILHDTKNGERRVLPLAGHALKLMKDLRKIPRIDTELVFPAPDGKKPVDIRQAWENAIEEAGIENFHFHDLRHSAASYLAMNGASLAEIAEVLGHKTLQMVKRYAHLSEAHTAGVVERMNQKIFG